MTDRPVYTLVLRDQGDPATRRGFPDRPGEYRLKLALKRLARDWGFRCTRAMPAPKDPTDPTPNEVKP